MIFRPIEPESSRDCIHCFPGKKTPGQGGRIFTCYHFRKGGVSGQTLPGLILREGERTQQRFIEFLPLKSVIHIPARRICMPCIMGALTTFRLAHGDCIRRVQ